MTYCYKKITHFSDILYSIPELTSVCPCVCPSVDRIMSALYLQQYLRDPSHVYISYQATSEGVLHIKFLQNSRILSLGI